MKTFDLAAEAKTITLADALPQEINRVREIQDQYKSMRGMPNIIVEPQIMLMEHAIQRAIQSCVQGDVIEMMRCYEELKGYEA